MSQAELARRLNISKATVSRWETGGQRPLDQLIVRRLVEVLRLNLDEALGAAGLLLDMAPPAQPTQHVDADVQLILASNLPEAQKQELMEIVMERRTRDEQQRVEDLQQMIRLAQRRRRAS